jgi:hypothetical protein
MRYVCRPIRTVRNKNDIERDLGKDLGAAICPWCSTGMVAPRN